MRSIADSCVPRASRGASDRLALWRSRVESNSQRAARREAAEHEKHGIEQSGVISAGEQARTHELLSSRNRAADAIRSSISKVSACGAETAPEAPIALPQEGHKATEEMVASMTSTRSTSSTKVVHCCWSGARVLIMGVSCANIGNNHSIIRRFTR